MSQYLVSLTSVFFLFLICVLPATTANGASTYNAKVVRVMDGDTLMVQASGRQEKVRLVGIDAPEYNQPYGTVARNALMNLLKGRTVRIAPVEHDRYGRLVARIYLDNLDVNVALVRDGYAWVYRQYADDAAFYTAEREARNARRGLWSQGKPVPPWEWRARERSYLR
ncbi:micrococcal nuclease [Gammaproteobacteria bacterium]